MIKICYILSIFLFPGGVASTATESTTNATEDEVVVPTPFPLAYLSDASFDTTLADCAEGTFDSDACASAFGNAMNQASATMRILNTTYLPSIVEGNDLVGYENFGEYMYDPAYMLKQVVAQGPKDASTVFRDTFNALPTEVKGNGTPDFKSMLVKIRYPEGKLIPNGLYKMTSLRPRLQSISRTIGNNITQVRTDLRQLLAGLNRTYSIALPRIVSSLNRTVKSANASAIAAAAATLKSFQEMYTNSTGNMKERSFALDRDQVKPLQNTLAALLTRQGDSLQGIMNSAALLTSEISGNTTYIQQLKDLKYADALKNFNNTIYGAPTSNEKAAFNYLLGIFDDEASLANSTWSETSLAHQYNHKQTVSEFTGNASSFFKEAASNVSSIRSRAASLKDQLATVGAANYSAEFSSMRVEQTQIRSDLVAISASLDALGTAAKENTAVSDEQTASLMMEMDQMLQTIDKQSSLIKNQVSGMVWDASQQQNSAKSKWEADRAAGVENGADGLTEHLNEVSTSGIGKFSLLADLLLTLHDLGDLLKAKMGLEADRSGANLNDANLLVRQGLNSLVSNLQDISSQQRVQGVQLKSEGRLEIAQSSEQAAEETDELSKRIAAQTKGAQKMLNTILATNSKSIDGLIAAGGDANAVAAALADAEANQQASAELQVTRGANNTLEVQKIYKRFLDANSQAIANAGEDALLALNGRFMEVNNYIKNWVASRQGDFKDMENTVSTNSAETNASLFRLKGDVERLIPRATAAFSTSNSSTQRLVEAFLAEQPATQALLSFMNSQSATELGYNLTQFADLTGTDYVSPIYADRIGQSESEFKMANDSLVAQFDSLQEDLAEQAKAALETLPQALDLKDVANSTGELFDTIAEVNGFSKIATDIQSVIDNEGKTANSIAAQVQDLSLPGRQDAAIRIHGMGQDVMIDIDRMLDETINKGRQELTSLPKVLQKAMNSGLDTSSVIRSGRVSDLNAENLTVQSVSATAKLLPIQWDALLRLVENRELFGKEHLGNMLKTAAEVASTLTGSTAAYDKLALVSNIVDSLGVSLDSYVSANQIRFNEEAKRALAAEQSRADAVIGNRAAEAKSLGRALLDSIAQDAAADESLGNAIDAQSEDVQAVRDQLSDMGANAQAAFADILAQIESGNMTLTDALKEAQNHQFDEAGSVADIAGKLISATEAHGQRVGNLVDSITADLQKFNQTEFSRLLDIHTTAVAGTGELKSLQQVTRNLSESFVKVLDQSIATMQTDKEKFLEDTVGDDHVPESAAAKLQSIVDETDRRLKAVKTLEKTQIEGMLGDFKEKVLRRLRARNPKVEYQLEHLAVNI